MDYSHDELASRRKFLTQSMMDARTWRALGIEVELVLPRRRVSQALEQLRENRGAPAPANGRNGGFATSEKVSPFPLLHSHDDGPNSTFAEQLNAQAATL